MQAKFLISVAYLFLLFQFSMADPIQDLITKAKIEYRRGQKKSALQLCYQAIEQSPQDAKLCLEIGKLLVNCGENEQGFALLEKTVQQYPSYDNYVFVAETADAQKQSELAISHYQAALKLNETPPVHRSLAFLYAEQGKIAESLQHRSRSVILEMPKLRGLMFKTPVAVNAKNRTELLAFLLKEFEKEMPPEKAQAIEATFKMFNLIPENCNIKQTMLKLLTEQISGFYNPETKELCLISEVKKKEGIAKLLSKARDDDEDRIVIAHEMTHALQDQYYDLQTLEKQFKENDDRLLAFQALLEGDATLSMLDYQGQPNRFSQEDVETLRLIFGLVTSFLPFLEGEEFSKCPEIIRENLLFPYMEGLFFVLTLRDDNDPWQGIDQAYNKIPSSTEQILHPEKYQIDEPVWDCNLPNFASVLGKGWKEADNNVIGEFNCRFILKRFDIRNPETCAEGWGGDRYSVLLHENGARALIWSTIWDSENDSQEFYQAYDALLQKKYRSAVWEKGENYKQTIRNNKITRLYREKKCVYIFEQIPKSAFENIQKQVLQLKFETK